MTSPQIYRAHFLAASNVAFVFLYALIFCIPWEDEASVAQGVAISHLVGLLACTVGLFAALISREIRKPHPTHYLLLMLVAWMAASYYWSADPGMTVIKAGSCAQLLIMVWLIWEFAPTEGRQVSLLGAYVLGSYVSILSTIYSFVTSSGHNIGLSVGRYTASGFDENELGITLALSLVMSCYLLARRAGWWPIWMLHIPLCVLAICLTGSRGAFISSAVAVLMFPLSFGRFSHRQKWMTAWMSLALLLITIFVVPRTTWERIGTIDSEISGGTLSKRTIIWTAGLDVYREHPIIGVGAGAFGPSVYSRLDIPYVAHNSYLSILVELGAVGAILFLLLFAELIWQAVTLPGLEARLWTILLMTWSVAVFSLTWEHRKPTWFLFGLLIAQSAALRRPHVVHAVSRSFAVA
jgi:O-antigen ligase